MLSSLIFVGLAAAWLIVLVPMFARRRQQVTRTADTALAARVVRRGSGRVAGAGGSRTSRGKEALAMPDTDRAGTDRDDDIDEVAEEELDEDGAADAQSRRVYSDDARAGRRYRPGRGGFDPEAAALAARTKYARRQRIVLGMLVTAVVTAVVAALAWPAVWWGHALVDVLLVGYLTYLRRQVRIEEDIRARRLARMSDDVLDEDAEFDDYDEPDERDERHLDDVDARDEDDWDEVDIDDEGRAYGFGDDEQEASGSRPRRRDGGERAQVPSRAVVLDIDDEDPEFDELDERTWSPYRRASGE